MAIGLKMVSTTINKSFNQRVYRLARRIPKGKVVTYGQIVSKLKSENGKYEGVFSMNRKVKINPRTVGCSLHQNKDQSVPCYRVVDRNGRIAKNFAFGGACEQRKRLLAEGVKFKDEMHVELDSCRWQE